MKDQNLTPAVTQEQQKEANLYKVLANSLRVSQIEDKDEVRTVVKEQIKSAYMVTGRDVHPTDLDIMVELLLKDLCGKFSRITIPEFKEAMYRGVRGEYGKLYGLNIAVFNEWVDGYLMSEQRVQALSRIPKIEEQLKQRTVPPDEAERIAEQAYETSLSKYRRTGAIYDLGHGVYDWLYRKGKVKITNGIMKKVFSEESDRLNMAIERAKAKLDRDAASKAEKELYDLDRNEPRLRSIAKDYVLKQYFDSLIINSPNGEK